MSEHARIKGELPPVLVRCPGCSFHVYGDTPTCPHCGGDFARLFAEKMKAYEEAQAALQTLERVLQGAAARANQGAE